MKFSNDSIAAINALLTNAGESAVDVNADPVTVLEQILADKLSKKHFAPQTRRITNHAINNGEIPATELLECVHFELGNCYQEEYVYTFWRIDGDTIYVTQK